MNRFPPIQLTRRGMASAVGDTSERTFKSLSISEVSKSAIKHEFMTQVQAETIDHALTGQDLLVQARTGTGKTLAFLLPAIETLSKSKLRKGVSILVLSPTRELAIQIAREAETLAHPHGLKVFTVYGGTNPRAELSKFNSRGCDILIATPGRLVDHLENQGFHRHLSDLKVYILDEVDRLLDVGFKPQLDKIQNYLPKTPRQTLHFSATLSKDVQQIAKSQLREGFKFINTIHEDERPTHEHVEQSHIIAPFSHHLPTLLHLIREDQDMNKGSSKQVIFFPTARHVDAAFHALSNIVGLPTLTSMHSRLSQKARERSSDKFRSEPSAILLCSDVAARGVDFPGVTAVFQVGLPVNGEQYIHRLGRTARAGAAGRGTLILDPDEQSFLSNRALQGISIPQKESLPNEMLESLLTVTNEALVKIDDKVKEQAYRAWLGYYNSNLKTTKWNKVELVKKATLYAQECLGWTEDLPPSLEAKTVGMMHLKNVPGLNIGRRTP
ncbi:DEAD-domain-containing protein [Guyanagaster necrorhizus]|uniref:ATP-dependent RNA helicase n=1 Tax=Guyanagaster necrorhizus TaxID=856835 RepID=A0A9P7VVZ4_9AGAR|nr:DEAD-domain-containing protein [Guyanagaster necrorhizus MCA 3950]KAG7447700.1 DEAD-domain-containing protein [Guyanagaster necrorhizus MCA 3950]